MKIFIVEDDPWYGELIAYQLGLNPEYEIERFETGKSCLANLYKNPEVITLDHSLPDLSGTEVLKQIKENLPDTHVIIISGQSDVNIAVNLLKEGAYDYIVKDDDSRERLWNTILKVKENNSLRKEIIFLKEELTRHYDLSKSIIGNSSSIKKVFGVIDKAIRTNITIVIKGETGTGKEVVAKAIHYNSELASKPFVAVNVAAIPNELIESELFGHEKGSFTGANTRKIGKFEEAGSGTLFLDEIAEMDLNMQVKLLRVLQERELTRVGGNDVVKLKFRLIVASHKDLANEVKEGRFREDLFFRLMGLNIDLPPLRNRGDDILLLVKHFAFEFCKSNKMKPVIFSADALDKLMSYNYPGNVRELKAITELAIVLAEGPEVRSDDIRFNNQLMVKSDDFIGENKTLKELNNEIIKLYLLRNDNNVVLVAKKLGIGKSTIYKLIQEGEL